MSTPLKKANEVAEQAGETETVSKLQHLAQIVVGAIIIIAIVAGIVALTRPKPMAYGYKTLKNGGHTYTFKFYANAVEKQSQGQNYYGYKSNDFGAIATAQPFTFTGPAYTSCSQLGAGWSELYKLNLRGKSYPVCMKGNVDFEVVYPVGKQLQLFSVVYQPAQSSSIYSDVRTIFGSL